MIRLRKATWFSFLISVHTNARLLWLAHVECVFVSLYISDDGWSMFPLKTTFKEQDLKIKRDRINSSQGYQGQYLKSEVSEV